MFFLGSWMFFDYNFIVCFLGCVMLSYNILAINKTRLIIKILYNVAAIYLQYFFKYCKNILF